MADSLFLRKGLVANLEDAAKINGALSFTTDEPAIYIDVEEDGVVVRKRIGDIKEFENLDALKAYITANKGVIATSGLYYAVAENALMKYTGENSAEPWKQINDTSGVATDVATIKGQITTLNTAVNAAQAAADKAQGEVDALEQTHATDKAALEASVKTVSDGLAAHKSAYATKIAALEKADTDNADAIGTLENELDAEVARAKGVENGLDSRLKTVEGNIGTGKVDDRIATAKSEAIADAKDYTDDAVAVEKERAQGVESGHAERIGTLENELDAEVLRAKGAEGANATAISNLQQQVGEGTVDSRIATAKSGAISAAKTETTTQVNALANGAVKTNTSNISSLQNLVGTTKVDDRIATAKSEAIADAKTETTSQVGAEKTRAQGEEAKIRQEFATADAALDARIDVLESNKNDVADQLNTITTDIDNLEKEAADIRADFAAADAQTLTDAKAYAKEQAEAVQGKTTETVASVNTKVSTLSNTVSSNYNTLDKKISDEASARATAITNVEKAYKAADAALKTEITGEYEAYVDSKLAAADAMKFMGVVNAAADLPTTGVEAGWTYKVGKNFALNGVNVYVGDLLIAEEDQDSSVTSYPASGWAHVAAGYEDDHDVHVALSGKKVSVINAAGQNRGSVEFAAAAGSSATVAVAQVAKDAQSGVTDVKVTVGLEWGSF